MSTTTEVERVTVETAGGGYTLEDGWVTEWWGADPPWVLFVGDYSQLEIRLLAHVSGDERLIDAIKNDVDIHAMTAQGCFDDVPKDISLKEVKERFGQRRKDAKPISFGVIYGMGPQALAAALGISEEEAEVIINDRYMALYPGVKAYIDRCHAMVKRDGLIRTPLGHPRHLPAAQLDRSDRNNRRLAKQAERQAQNAPIQGFAAGIIKIAMRDIRRYCRKTGYHDVPQTPPRIGTLSWVPAANDVLWKHYARTLLQVHDELVQEFHPAIANHLREQSVAFMEKAVSLKVPIKVDAKLGVDWASTKE